ncbi:MAG: isoprenylcysteine carboxylmethyltransferase family protein [Clostridia bacterium]|nr:isoprenylcysteine carboxylmethyltransferase family protein [Clostridia bacterium]
MKLWLNALIKYLLGLILVGLLVFLPAGTLCFPHGWLFMGILFVPMLILGIVLLVKSPALLEKRLDSQEKRGAQKSVTSLAAVMFLGGFIVAGLDHRYGWSHVPAWGVVAAAVMLLAAYALYAEVMRENAYLSRTIAVQAEQKVVDSGLYGIVRHPMYAVTLWLFLAIPLVLGSLWAVLCFLPYLPLIIVRILDEEKLLSAELEGYTEYKKKVKYRLIPLIW